MKTKIFNRQSAFVAILFTLVMGPFQPAQAARVNLINPSFQGRPILAEQVLDTWRSDNGVTERANIICQMAGYARATQNVSSIDVKFKSELVVNANIEIFNVDSIAQDRPSWHLKTAMPFSTSEPIGIDEKKSPRFVVSKSPSDCLVATACRNLRPNQMLPTIGTPENTSPFLNKCIRWGQKSKELMVFTELSCETDHPNDYQVGSNLFEQQFAADLATFHQRTQGRFALDQTSLPLEATGTRVADRKTCESPLTRGSLVRPRMNDCDYNEWRSDDAWAKADSIIDASPLTFAATSGRMKPIATTAPTETIELIKRYELGFLKPEYDLAKGNPEYSLNFCVNEVSGVDVKAINENFVGCSYTVKGLDLFRQDTQSTINKQSPITKSGVESDLERVKEICESEIKYWTVSELSCPVVNFCPPPGISSRDGFHYQD